MDEIQLWRWRFTDENGKRRVTSWHMTEPDVREYAHVYKDAEKVDAGDSDGQPIDERFSALAIYIRAGNLYECAWQLLKYGHFKGMEDEAAALARSAWARRNQIHVMFEVRRVREHDVVYVLMRDKRQRARWRAACYLSDKRRGFKARARPKCKSPAEAGLDYCDVVRRKSGCRLEHRY